MNQILLNVLATVVTCIVLPLISFLGVKLTQWLNTKIKDEKGQALIGQAVDIVLNAVRSVFQTYVESLKNSGNFTSEAQKNCKCRWCYWWSSTPASYGFSVQPVGGSTAVGAYITVPFEVDGGINFDQVHALVYDEQAGNWDALFVSRDLISYKDNGRIVSVGLAYDQVGAKLLRLIAYKESIQVALSDTFVVNWNIAEMSVQPVGATILVGTSYTFTWKTNFDARFRILCFDGEDWGAIGETINSSYTVTQNSEKSLIYQVCADVPFKMANGSTNYVYDVAVSQTFIVNWVEAAPTEYVVNYAPGEGSGSSDMDYVEAGSTITLKTPQELGFLAPDGKVFDAWQINGVKYDAGR